MNILIIEDDHALNQGIALSLNADHTYQAYTIAEAREYLSFELDLILLDINLPDGSGLTLCQEIRRISQVPILILTAKDLEIDIVTGLESGADDYITKPFSLMVLRARVHAVLRRKALPKQTYIQGRFSFDFERMEFLIDNESIELSKTEQKLLRLLVFHAGQTMPREILIDRIWSDGAEFVEENALSVTMKRLREKLPGIPVRTIYGIGYLWER